MYACTCTGSGCEGTGSMEGGEGGGGGGGRLLAPVA